jgi:glycerate-2-kinase
LFAEPTTQPFCAISGGEFSCPVRGDGRGGRNLETVLRCAIRLDESKTNNGQHFVVLSAGTDGIDGNSPAAGAIADETTISRARELGLDAHQYLARSDSYGFFERLNTLIMTGPTGTNVRDLRIFLRSS